MSDAISRSLDKISLLLGVPPWVIVLAPVLLIALMIGVRLLVRNSGPDGLKLDWRRDPDELTDLSPHLRRARLQMIGAGIGMLALLFIALLGLLQD